MPLRNKPLDEITEIDLQVLIDNKVAEGKEYDYKSALGNSDGDKKEFLADVSSFANTVGGHLLLGIEEVGGVPTSFSPLIIADVDDYKLRLENMLRDSIAPRITGIGIQPVSVGSGTVLVIRVPKSWASPHMVTYGKSSKFFARNSGGKYPLDVHEIRSAFVASETTINSIRSFRLERTSKVVDGDTPSPLAKGAALVLHVMPLSAFSQTDQIDMNLLIKNYEGQFSRFKHDAIVNEYRYNFDGLLLFGIGDSSVLDHSYVQFFRNGTVEYADTYSMGGGEAENLIAGGVYEQSVIGTLAVILSIYQRLGIQTPVVVLLSLVNVLGYIMAPRKSRGLIGKIDPWHRIAPIDRNVLLVPELMIESLEVNPSQIMKPAFDAVWNACGYPQSQNYDESGNWLGP